MPSAVLPLLAIGAALVCIRGPLRWAGAILVFAPFVVPDAVPISSASHALTFLRLLVLASSIGVVLRASAGEISWRSLRPGRVHAVLLGFVLVTYMVGVAWAPWPADFHSGFEQWLALVDQLLLLWCVVAYARTLGSRWLAQMLVAAAATVAGIGVIEKVTGASFAHWWYSHLGIPGASQSFGGPLELRGGTTGAVRVRAAEQFALEFAWVLTIMVPLSLSVAWTSTRKWVRLVPVLLVLAIVLTITRGAFAGLAVGAAVWVLLSRLDRRAVMVVCSAGVLGFLLYVGVPSLHHPYRTALPDSLQSRIIREDFVTTAVEHNVVTGLGFDGLVPRGVSSTDSTFVQTYGTLGVLGLVGLASILLIPAAVAAGAGLLRRSRFAAASAAGLAAGAVGLLTFDGLSLAGFAWPLWMLAAVGVAAADENAVARTCRVSPRRLLLPLAGVAIGLIAIAFVSPRATTISTFRALADSDTITSSGDNSYIGVIEINTICTAGTTALAAIRPHVFCRGDPGIGQGFLQISGANPAIVAGELAVWDQAATAVDSAYTRTVVERFHSRSTPVRTSPLYLGLAGLILAITLPPRRVSTNRPRVTV